MSALDDVLCCRGVADAVAADRGDTMLGEAVAEVAALRAEVERLRNECIVVGGAHSAVHAERISLRAEVERLRIDCERYRAESAPDRVVFWPGKVTP